MKFSTALPCLLLSVSLVPTPGSASERLLAARAVDGGCEILAWRPSDRQSQALVTLGDCAERLFLSERTADVFYLEGGEIIRLPLGGQSGPQVIARAPELTIEGIAPEAFARPLSDYEKMTATRVMSVRNVGTFDDGTLWVHVGIVMAGDDDYDFLFRRVDGDWRFEEFVHCGRFGVCGFETLAGEKAGADSDPVAPEIWDERIAGNPYHVRDERGSPVDYGYRYMSKIDRYFRIDDQDVLLEVWTGEGPDSGYPYTGGAVLHIAGGDTVVICETQCHATLTGRFLLAERFWGGTLELYDMMTGASVLGALEQALWFRVAESGGAD